MIIQALLCNRNYSVCHFLFLFQREIIELFNSDFADFYMKTT